MIKETVTMSHKELDRLQIIQESVNRHITQEQAASRIGISVKPKADHPWLTRRTQSHEQVPPPALPKKRADVDKMK